MQPRLHLFARVEERSTRFLVTFGTGRGWRGGYYTRGKEIIILTAAGALNGEEVTFFFGALRNVRFNKM